MKAIIHGRLLLPGGEESGQALLFDEKIFGAAPCVPEGCEVIDARGLYVSPGFVDIHIHGYGGADASDGDEAGLRNMARRLLENGVTSFLPTTMTVDWPQLERAFAAIRALQRSSAAEDFSGAQVLGCHAEGPFINPARKGAQKESAILPPDAAKIAPYSDVIRLVTLAPEMPGAAACIRALRQLGVRVSLGHTDADFETALMALRQGADHFSHLFNAMSPLLHRAPGAAGAALASDAWCELIADGLHVHEGLFPLLRRVKGERLVLITDCVRAGGLTDGLYDLGGQMITVRGKECRLPDGTLAGSVLRMNDAVRLWRDASGAPLHEAVHAAALAPARAVGLEACKGSLERGKDADIVLLDDDVQVQGVFVRGVRKR